MADIVPSIRYAPDDPRPIGFAEEVSTEHLGSAGDALAAVAAAVNAVRGKGGDAQLRIRLCSARYAPALPFNLFGFHVLDFNEEGEFTDEIGEGRELNYALIANHAVEVQREIALLFLFELVHRQIELKALMSGDRPVVDRIPATAAHADERARAEFTEKIRAGWAEAARSIAQRAHTAGLELRVQYEVDVLPTREAVSRRIPQLRAAYNEIDLAREAVDKVVSMIGGRDPRLITPGLRPLEEDKLQRQFASMGIRHWVSQTVRDAEVCGNGYLVTVPDPYPALYALRPEDVEVLGEHEFRLVGPSAADIEGHVLHVRGIEQFESAYGISFLEPLLAQYRTLRTFREATRFAQQVIATHAPGTAERRWADATLGLAERSLADLEGQLERLLWFPREWLPGAREGLYFPGQERM